MLDRWRQHRRDEDPGFDPGDVDGHVFCRPDGTPTHPQLLSDAFKKPVQRSRLPRIRFHDLSHTHATLPPARAPGSVGPSPSVRA